MRRVTRATVVAGTAAFLVLAGAGAAASVRLLATSPTSSISLCVGKNASASSYVRTPARGVCGTGYALVTAPSTAMSPVVFTANGTYEVPKGVHWLRVELYGAGAGGESLQGNPTTWVPVGGGGGALVTGLLSVGSCSSAVVVVGPGGHGAGGSSSVSVGSSCKAASLVAGGGSLYDFSSNTAPGGVASYSGAAVMESHAPGGVGTVSGGGNSGGGSGGASGNQEDGGTGGGGFGSTTSSATGTGGSGIVIVTPL